MKIWDSVYISLWEQCSIVFYLSKAVSLCVCFVSVVSYYLFFALVLFYVVTFTFIGCCMQSIKVPLHPSYIHLLSWVLFNIFSKTKIYILIRMCLFCSKNCARCRYRKKVLKPKKMCQTSLRPKGRRKVENLATFYSFHNLSSF